MQNHAGMGWSLTVAFGTNTKVLLTTRSEHGFADNTNFYFVNTVSPKILEVPDSTATAPDGRPFIDPDEQANIVTLRSYSKRSL